MHKKETADHEFLLPRDVMIVKNITDDDKIIMILIRGNIRTNNFN